MDKSNRTLMVLVRKKKSSIKFNYPQVLGIKKKILSKGSIKTWGTTYSPDYSLQAEELAQASELEH
jgi:hypothetical protein